VAARGRQQLLSFRLGQIHFCHAPHLNTNRVLFQ
jgi:hypothetical protein